MRRNEETLNFKKEISGRDWVLTRVLRLSILKSGEKVRGRLVDVPCLLVGGRRYEIQMLLLGGTCMCKIGIVCIWHGGVDSDTDTDTTGP